MGPRISEATAELFAKNAYRDYLELHGLSVQLTEALAEYWHARVRARARHRRLAIPDDLDGFFRRRLPRRAVLLRLPAPARTWPTGPRWCACSSRRRIGVELSEEMQLHPEQSTDAIVVHHPEAKYFSV